MTESILRLLSADEQIALQAGLELAATLASASLPLSIEQVQILYDDAIESATDDAETLIAIGLAFGDLIARRNGFEWARISDEYGDETCVAAVGKITHCAPISMIQKRLRRSESIDIAELMEGTMKVLQEQADRAAPRGNA